MPRFLAVPKSLILALAMSFASGGAHAQSMAGTGLWTGPYAGFQAGSFQAIHTLSLAGTPCPGQCFNSLGPAVGLFAGYLWQGAGRLVYGLEAEINGARYDTLTQLGAQQGLLQDVTYRTSVDMTAAARIRIGLAYGRTLFYGTLGVASDRMAFERSLTGTAAVTHQARSWRSGWAVGLGVERALRDNWRLRLDYRHADHGRRNYATTFPEPLVSDHVRSSELRIGLSRRF